jgi:GT2 family glycosyltransferase/glycosyltransferase involved in cell wall biosynthesis
MNSGATNRGETGLDVIVPVFGAAMALERCLQSLESHVDPRAHRILLVVDGPQAPEVERLLRSVAERRPPPALCVLRQERRAGYPAAIVRGISYGQEEADAARDVVLLNSDTIVTGGWLDKLARAAAVSPRTGTVTPFTNNGTLASIPRSFEINRLPTGFDAESFGALVEGSSARLYPQIPTAVGFCFYVKRALLREIGSFDAAAFGLGYGEEVDFCLRATAAGWEHRLDDATFVFHQGQSSFGRTRSARVRAAERTIARRYPDFRSRLAAFMAEDPLAAARQPILDALRRASAAAEGPGLPAPAADRASLVHLVHGWPPENFAGTELYAWWLAHRQKHSRAVAVYTRSADPHLATGTAVELDDRSLRVRALVNHFDPRDPLRRNGLYDSRARADFARFLDQTRPDLVHVHHLAGHGFSLVAEARRRRLPILLQLQDWWLPCARANLLDRERRLCPGPAPGRCSHCLPLTEVSPSPAFNRLLNRNLYRLRERRARAVLGAAEAIVAGSAAILDSFRALGWLPEGVPVHLVPYGVPVSPLPPWRAPALPLRLGFIGSLLPHKGLHVATRAMAGVPAEAAELEVWGDAERSPAYVAEALAAAQGAAVRLRGSFAEEERERIFAGLDLLIVPSLGLESYSLVAREALASGLPVLASRRGALGELFAGRPDAGGHFDPERPEELRAWIERLAADPRQLAEWRRGAERAAIAAPPPTLAEHFAALEPIYEQLLSASRQRGR